MELEFSKSFIKKIYDLNQDCKSLFNAYILFPSGIILSEKNMCTMDIGIHYCTTNYTFGSKPIKFYSSNIFNMVKEDKKNLSSLTIDDNNNICIIGGRTHIIGTIIDAELSNMTNMNIMYENIVNNINTFMPSINLNENDVIDLMQNNYKDIRYDKYFSRITRKLIPGMKKTHSVDIMFHDSNKSDIFSMQFKCKRQNIESYHEYKCLYM